MLRLGAFISHSLLLLRIAPYLVSFEELGDDFRVLFQRTGLVFLRNLVERRKIG